MALPGLQGRSVPCAGMKSWGRASSHNPLIIPIHFQGSQLPAGIQLCLPDSLSSPNPALPWSLSCFYHPKAPISGPAAGGCGTRQPAWLTGADLVISWGQSPGPPASAQAGGSCRDAQRLCPASTGAFGMHQQHVRAVLFAGERAPPRTCQQSWVPVGVRVHQQGPRVPIGAGTACSDLLGAAPRSLHRKGLEKRPRLVSAEGRRQLWLGGGDKRKPLPGGSPQDLAPSLPSQLLLTTRTLVDGAGASEFPEEFRSQELRQVWGGGKPDPSRRGGDWLARHRAPRWAWG